MTSPTMPSLYLSLAERKNCSTFLRNVQRVECELASGGIECNHPMSGAPTYGQIAGEINLDYCKPSSEWSPQRADLS